jgi:hypothetical protein
MFYTAKKKHGIHIYSFECNSRGDYTPDSGDGAAVFVLSLNN